MFAIFTIKLLFLGIIFINQACQTEDSPVLSQDQALINFEQELQITQPKLGAILQKSNMSLGNETIKKNVKENQLGIETADALAPLVNLSLDLFESFGYNTKEISEEFGSLSDSRIALLGMLVYASEKAAKNKKTAFNPSYNLFGNKVYAANAMVKMPVWAECAIEAIGFDVFISASKVGFEKAIKKGWKKAIGKIASRFLGPVGVAAAVAEFAWCMYTS